MAALTREQILARKTGRGTVTLPSDGATVHIRALTRDEALTVQGIDDLGQADTYVIATGMTDPALSLDDVAAWASADSAGDLAAVSEGIAELSGMTAGAGKAATKRAARRR